jgi:beta-galactosidase
MVHKIYFLENLVIIGRKYLLMMSLWSCSISIISGQVNPDSLNFSRSNSGFTSDVYNGERGVSFNRDWKFYLGNASGAEKPVYNDAGWRTLSVPHDWSIELAFNKNSASGHGGGCLDGGIGWYRKSFKLPAADAGKRITIQFDGVYMNSDVWINGTHLGLRPYGFTTFEYDLTPYLNFASTNVIAVKVNNNQPNCRWYSGSGIYRNVWLTVTDPVHVAYCGSFATQSNVSAASAKISIATTVENHSAKNQPVFLISTIYDQANKVVGTVKTAVSTIASSNKNTFSGMINISNPILWGLNNPYLYTVKTQVYINNTVTDKFTSRLGIRYLAFDANKGFSLNGVNTKIHGVCMHHDLGSLGAAQNYRALERQVEILKTFGTNAIRTSHNPPAPELLEICDRLGVLVLDEAFDAWLLAKTSNDYHLYFKDWAQRDVQNWIQRDRNHASVILWSIGNEIWDGENASSTATAKSLIGWVHDYDTSRGITMALFSSAGLNNIADLLDVVGFNYFLYASDGSQYDSWHKSHPNWKLLGSETSSAVRSRGVYHTPVTSNVLTAADYQCSSYDNSVVSWGHGAEKACKVDKERPFVAGEFIWTGFDYMGEPIPYENDAKSSYFGIVDMCGFPKDVYYLYQSQWTSTPMVHLLPYWNWKAGDNIPVFAYTNCDSVKLTMNGKALGTKKFQNGALHLEWNVPYEAGMLIAQGYKNGSAITADTVKTAGAATKLILKADRKTIHADNSDLVFIETDLLDSKNVLVPNTNNPITYSISGPGEIVGVDNGNAMSYESFRGTQRNLFNGKALVIVRSTCAEGAIVVSAKTTGTGITQATVTVNSVKFKTQPVIVQDKDTLRAFPLGYTYQWYLNGKLIPGATDQTYVKTQGGAYKVEVTDGNGCAIMSDSEIATAVDEQNNGLASFTIYPNPAREKIIIETDPENSIFNVRLFSIQGLLIREKKYGESYAEMDIKNLGSGIYILELSNSKGTVCKRFVKE